VFGKYKLPLTTVLKYVKISRIEKGEIQAKVINMHTARSYRNNCHKCIECTRAHA